MAASGDELNNVWRSTDNADMNTMKFECEWSPRWITAVLSSPTAALSCGGYSSDRKGDVWRRRTTARHGRR